MRQADRWIPLVREHEEFLADFQASARRVFPNHWHRPLRPRRWSPAALTEHVIKLYEPGRAATSGVEPMRLNVSRPVALLARNIVLPIFLAGRTFRLVALRRSRSARTSYPLTARLVTAQTRHHVRALEEFELARNEEWRACRAQKFCLTTA